MFNFDTKQHIDNMEHCVIVDIIAGQLTLFGLVCINEDNASSHGGQLVSTIRGERTEDSVREGVDKAVAAALDSNVEAAKQEGHTCKYVPVAMGLPAALLPQLAAQLFHLPAEEEDE